MRARSKPTRVLQFAPEPEIEARFRAFPETQFVSVDLAFGRAEISADIEHLPFAGGSFDVVYCSHVLEHVDDDEAAMRELRRVVSPTGCAVVLVPITAEATWGDPTITDPDRRTELFGQHDHVRVFGPDVRSRLERAGWIVDVTSVDDLPAEDVDKFGLPSLPEARAAGEVFLCRASEQRNDE